MGKYAWERAKDFREPLFPQTLVLPPDQLPFDFIWPVSAQEIYLIDTSITDMIKVREFIACLFSFGADVVNYLSINVSMTKFKKESENELK